LMIRIDIVELLGVALMFVAFFMIGLHR